MQDRKLNDLPIGDYAENRRAEFLDHLYPEVPFNTRDRGCCGAGCGAHTVALLSGRPVEKSGVDLDDIEVVSRLKKRGFKIFPLTLCRLSDHNSICSETYEENVILASLLVRRGECSWFVLHKGVAYHNFDKIAMNSLFLLNKPIRSAYVISHPKWVRARERRCKLG